ncbi:hypothetical protein J4212_00330 [Candidatus Woesearchaeota archaeon]|nr:hypothetical protein [Candidatus Woesearchaeota archaeon]
MVKAIHQLSGERIEKDVEKADFILTSGNGSYLYLGDYPESRYQGFFIYENSEMLKVLELISVKGAAPIDTVKNLFYSVQRKRGMLIETFFLPRGKSSMMYSLNEKREIEIFLDFKKSYDNRVWGLSYSTYEQDGCIIIEFTKATDSREDASSGQEEYKAYLAIKSDTGKFSLAGNWIKHDYNLDKTRGSIPNSRFVCHALNMEGSKFFFSASFSKEKAIGECISIFQNNESILKGDEQSLGRIIASKDINRIKDREKRYAYISSLLSLSSLVVKEEKSAGIFAGLPWFFQFWARDAAISCRGLKSIDLKLSKKILFDMLGTMNNEGRVLNIYSLSDKDDSNQAAGIASTADATGWIFLRLYWLFREGNLNIIERAKAKKLLLDAIRLSEGRINEEGFEANREKETWMDTSDPAGKDRREGIRIEIQALRLMIYRFAYELTGMQKFLKWEELMKERVLSAFYKDGMLADGVGDFTVRPNIFIAYYAYPWLLDESQWKLVFDLAIKKLWLDWGGFATIEKGHPLFQWNYTGESNASYHRGDSWFWVNCLAALCMLRLDSKKYYRNILKVMEAGTQEILWMGAISHHSEVSSASSLKSEGCMMQAWSSAMFLELLQEFFSV